MFFDESSKVSYQARLLVVGDFFCIADSILVACMLRLSLLNGWDYFFYQLPLFATTCALTLTVFYAGGMYQRQVVLRREGQVRRPLLMVFVSFSLSSLLSLPFIRTPHHFQILALAAGLTLVTAWLLRMFYRLAVGYKLFLKKAVILGDGGLTFDAVYLLNTKKGSGITFSGLVTCSTNSNQRFFW